MFPRALETNEPPGSATHSFVALGKLPNFSEQLSFPVRKEDFMSILQGGCTGWRDHVSTVTLCWRSIDGHNYYPIIGETMSAHCDHISLYPFKKY